MRRAFLALCALFFVVGCSADTVWAPDEDVARVAYSHDGPPRLTLFTMINNTSGNGGHSSLMINSNQRIIFDPAGSFKHPTLPERNDVVFGITPQVADVYTRYHARQTWHVKVQELDVTPEVAARVSQLALNYGAVPSAMCAQSTSSILAQVFPNQVSTTWYPVKLAASFATVPGVRQQVLREFDDDDNGKVLKEWNPNAVAQMATVE